MGKRVTRVTACLLTGILTVSAVPYAASAAPTAGVSSYTSNIMTSSALPSAGVSLALTQCMIDSGESKVLATAQPVVEENAAPVVASEYADIAVAQVDDYVNVRSTPSEEGEIVGKLYNNSAATVVSAENGWSQITSGNVQGYVKSEFVVVGDEALSKSVSRRVAQVTSADMLRVRASATTDSDVLGNVPNGEYITVIDESVPGWIGVSIEEGTGYVSSEFVTLSTEYTYAESKAEEEARLAKEEAERKAAAEAAEAARKKSESASSSKSSSSKNSNKTYNAPSGSNGSAVVSYAEQFVGNPYVYGGTSLTNGADCSGFVMSVYSQFGVSLPHSSSAMRSCGYEVDPSEMQPGDIICYSGHVAIYAGNNTIVHAATPSSGIKYTSPANYNPIITVRRIY